jgi:hypothetical protein
MPDETDYWIAGHIADRRLFEMAAGSLRLQKWEQQHLHECEQCQTILFVLVDPGLDSIAAERR